MADVCPVSAQDHPEPVEPPMVSVPGGIYCIVHGVMDCRAPWCWRCGNHDMDPWDRCADPRCRATCTPEALEIVAEVKALWPDRPAPLEVITVALGYRLLPPSLSSPAASSGADVAHDPGVRPVPELR